MTVCPDPLCLFLVLMLSHFCCSIRWLALSQAPYSLATKQVQLCHQLPGLTPSQVQLCRSHVELMDTVAQAARQVKQTCQETFRDMRWNCSSLDSGPRFLPDLQRGTRESAFVYALSSAAISHAIARACSSGDLRACSCGPVPGQPPHQPGDRWGGCADNLQYGLLVGSRFADAPILVARKSRPQPSRMMHLHNSEVGRQALRATLQLKCKCHGVSGSCSVRTCWRGLQDLRDVAIDLKARYLSATRVVHRPGATVGRLVPKDIDVRPLGDSELIYLQSSPDFCTQNDRRGSFGTQNRQCNRTSTGSDGCDLMCCGRGYVPYTESLTERCHCRYHWCCYVTCRTCQRTVERYSCK